MVREIGAFVHAVHARRLGSISQTRYEIVGPYQVCTASGVIEAVPVGSVLLAPRFIGVCQADVRYIAGLRPPEILRERLPMAPFHEGVAEVLETGPGVNSLTPGQRVVVVPNIPCYVHDPLRYPSKDSACLACRPGGAGENYCIDVVFLASNAHGLAQSCFLHPAEALLPVPEEVPDEIAALAEPLSVAWAAIEASSLTTDAKVLVLGAGVMGFLTTFLLAHACGLPRECLVVSDLDAARLERVQDWASTCLATGKAPPHAGSFSRVFECVGGRASATTIQQAIDWLMPGGVCVLIGVSEESVPVRTRRVLDKGLSLRGTTRSARTHFAAIMPFLADRRFQEYLRRVFSGRVFPGHSCEAIVAAARAAADPQQYGKVFLDWRARSACGIPRQPSVHPP